MTSIKENLVSKSDVQNQKANKSFPIVGIGASAGGLEALELFFQNMPINCGMAFVVIQHLDPTRIGIMPELLQRTTEMPVTQVTDYLKVEPNHIYVIPPNRNMTLLNGFLYLFEPVELRGFRLPIDYFFNSLAEDQLSNSVGIILSGMGSDGTIGQKAIKDKGGIVVVQNPTTAKYNAMPQSVLNNVAVDIVADAHEIPAKLMAFLTKHSVISPTLKDDEKSKSNVDKIIILIRTQTGNDFSQYKRNTIYRRIERRMSIHQIDTISNYVRFLQENPLEIEVLFKELLIGVTNFFREPDIWETLKDKVLPEMLETAPNGQILRAWIPGCSTGEEAYSLAITFLEAVDKMQVDKNITLQIFATDIQEDAIDKARTGVFSSNIAHYIPENIIEKYFIKEETTFRVKPRVREMVVFATHSVIKDPPFTKLNLLFCRNLLIYLESVLQLKLINLFHFSLTLNGVLFLGSAENVHSQSNLFEAIDIKKKLYRRLSNQINPEKVDFPSSFTYTKKQT